VISDWYGRQKLLIVVLNNNKLDKICAAFVILHCFNARDQIIDEICLLIKHHK